MLGHYSLIQYHKNVLRQEGINYGVVLVRPNYATEVKIYFQPNVSDVFTKQLEDFKSKLVNTVFTVNDLRNWPRYHNAYELQLTYPVSIFMTTESTLEDLYKELVL